MVECEPNPAAFFGIMAMFGIFWLVVMVVIIVISIGFIFAYPLIVDRKLQGFDAIKLSFKAALANFWRLLGMVLLTSLLSVLGVLACYVGIFWLCRSDTPQSRRLTSRCLASSEGESTANLPPPPPVFN